VRPEGLGKLIKIITKNINQSVTILPRFTKSNDLNYNSMACIIKSYAGK
jgi:hypothetical protein